MFLQENLDGNILETGRFLNSHVQCKTKPQILLVVILVRRNTPLILRDIFFTRKQLYKIFANFERLQPNFVL